MSVKLITNATRMGTSENKVNRINVGAIKTYGACLFRKPLI